MKLAIFGSYNGTSIGDTAILLGLLHGIAQVAPQAQVTVLSMGPVDLARDLALTGQSLAGLARAPDMVRANIHAPAEWLLVRSLWWRLERLGLPLGTAFNSARVRKILAGHDLLIIGGGNLLMDLFEGGVTLIENITTAAQTAGTPYVFAGVGAGPVAQATSRARLGVCLAGAQRVVVRDAPSQQLCRDGLGRANTRCAPDLAFALDHSVAQGARTTLAVNVAAIGSPTWPVQDAALYDAYLDGMARLVVQACGQIQPARVEIITSNPAVDLGAGRDLMARLQGQAPCPVTLPPLRDVTDILDAFGRAKMAIVTRLHAGIMAAHAGAQVLPVAYQPKVAAVLAEAGIAPAAIALDDLCRPDFDTSAPLLMARTHPAGISSDTRAQALAAIRDLLPAAMGARA